MGFNVEAFRLFLWFCGMLLVLLVLLVVVLGSLSVLLVHC